MMPKIINVIIPYSPFLPQIKYHKAKAIKPVINVAISIYTNVCRAQLLICILCLFAS